MEQEHQEAQEALDTLIYPSVNIFIPDERTFCTACEESYQTQDNCIILCRVCRVPVHIECHQGDLVGCKKLDDWCCESCTELSTQLIPQDIQCQLCSQSNMIMRSYLVYCYKNCFKMWAHISCMKSVKSLTPLKDGIYRVKNLQQIFNMNDTNTCCFCQTYGGHIIQCGLAGCGRKFHLGCCKVQGMLIDGAGMSLIRESFEGQSLKYIKHYHHKIRESSGIFCLGHVYKKYQEYQETDEEKARKFNSTVIQVISSRRWWQ